MPKTNILPALCLSLSLGCGGDELVGRQELPILNGSEDSGHPAVGIMVGTNKSCTGTLVGPRTVLTAAHCLQEKVTYLFRVGEKTYKAVSVIPHPGWAEVDTLPEIQGKWTFSVNDVGLLLLSEQVQGIAPIRLATQAPKLGQPVTLVGFGLTDPGKPASGGTKHKVENIVGSFGATWVLIGTGGGIKGGPGVSCSGDSGGPLLVSEEGEERVLGVHSMGNCSNLSQAERITPHLEWLGQKSGGNLGAELDLVPPEILFESPELDAIRPPDFEIVVKITDASGLESAVLSLDGRELLSTSDLLVKHTLTGVAAGDHELTLVAVDRVGNRAEMTRSVRVQPRAEPETSTTSEEVVLEETAASGCSLGGRGAADPWFALGLALLLLRRRRR